MVEYITDEEGNVTKKVTTVQENGWTRINYYHADGTIEEIYEGKSKKKYESNKWYSCYYHYMHDHPNCIVKIECEGCLIERTLKLLQKDPLVIIDDIKEIKK